MNEDAAAPQAGEFKTDDQLGGLLASIRNYGSWKYAEAKGRAQPDLSEVRAAWDEVYEKVQALAAQRPTDDDLWDKTLKERDDYHEMADQLAAQIAAITGEEIGEHTYGVNGYTPKATAQAVPAVPLLAKDHQGMRVDYSGLLQQAANALVLGGKAPGLAEMLRQLQGHMTELGLRWYASDTAVVDELCQLYCVGRDARVALTTQGASHD